MNKEELYLVIEKNAKEYFFILAVTEDLEDAIDIVNKEIEIAKNKCRCVTVNYYFDEKRYISYVAFYGHEKQYVWEFRDENGNFIVWVGVFKVKKQGGSHDNFNL